MSGIILLRNTQSYWQLHYIFRAVHRCIDVIIPKNAFPLVMCMENVNEIDGIWRGPFSSTEFLFCLKSHKRLFLKVYPTRVHYAAMLYKNNFSHFAQKIIIKQ